MGCGTYLKELLRPLGAYRLENSINGGELEAFGGALDGCGALLEALEREMSVATAQGPGLDAVERLFSRKPLAPTQELRRAALSALLRVGGDSFTLAAVNDNLAGCGVNAQCSETGTPGAVEVRFPDVRGIPDEFEELKKRIEDILPCHLDIAYVFWYATWAMLEERFGTWGALEGAGLSWGEIEKLAE